MPSDVHVVGVEVLDVESVGEGLTPAVERAVAPAGEAVRRAVEALTRR